MSYFPYYARAFHPQTMGVIKPCTVLRKTRAGLRVRFEVSLTGKPKTFTLPLDHVFDR